ncbi:MAG TPA: alpha/beta hydrolase [Saprospiraceae bacterium]|nr:alpha/beta hydrolase [Saprospiraceae bacterium]
MYKSIITPAAIFAGMNLTCLLDNHKIAFSRHGTGDVPVVLLHGFCEDQRVWAPILPHLSKLPFLLIDLPGFGQSDTAHIPSMQAYAAVVKAVLDDQGISSCVLVGHSMGGYVALEFAAHWPEYLAGLGLFHSHPFTDNEERKTARKRGLETLLAGKRDLYVTQLFPNLFAPAFQASRPDIIQSLTDNGKQQSAEAIMHALQAMLDRQDHQQTLAALPCPSLFLLGQKDTLIPFEQGIKAGLLPQKSMIELLPEAGHMAMWEDPGLSSRLLNRFYQWCLSYKK